MKQLQASPGTMKQIPITHSEMFCAKRMEIGMFNSLKLSPYAIGKTILKQDKLFKTKV